jgi:hypothetical protein
LKAAAIKAYDNRDQHPLGRGIGSLPEVKRPLDDAPLADADSNDSTLPAAIDEVFGGLLGPDRSLGSGFFSTEQLPDPSAGGMNWYFAPSARPRDPLFGFEAQGSGVGFAEVPAVEDAGAMWTELLRQLGSPGPTGTGQ